MTVLQATIELEFKSSTDANLVLQAISPDNSPLPTGIEICSETVNESLRIYIKCNRGINSFSATIEDIMSAIDLAIRTCESLE